MGELEETLELDADFEGLGDVGTDASSTMTAAVGSEARNASDNDAGGPFGYQIHGPACHEEFYGTMSRGKWRAKFWDKGTQVPHRVSARVLRPSTLLAGGQPKEDIYSAIRKAYGKDDGADGR